jgi:general stress protein 26
MNSEPHAEIKIFKNIIQSIHTGILYTRGKKNELKGRPMETISVDKLGSFWFFTSEFSDKVVEIWRNNEVFINYSNLSGNAYIMVTGKAYLNRDINKITELYDPSVKAWLPEGLNDPNLLLLRIEPSGVEYFYNGKPEKNVSDCKILSQMFAGKEYEDNIRLKANLNLA